MSDDDGEDSMIEKTDEEVAHMLAAYHDSARSSTVPSNTVSATDSAAAPCLSLFGRALLDFWHGLASEPLIYARVCDGFAVEYDMYFYFTREFPPLERRALAEAAGSVLDVGAGTGRHAAELLGMGAKNALSALALDRRNPNVTAVSCMELLPEGCYIMLDRGLDRVYLADVLDEELGTRDPVQYRDKRVNRGRQFLQDSDGQPSFDTILVLGDSLGMVGTLDRVEQLLLRLRQWVVEPNGKLLLDCSDIHEELARAPAGLHAKHVDSCRAEGRYVGESKMQYAYQGETGSEFWWCYVDWKTLVDIAQRCGWSTRLLQTDGIEYLAELRPILI